MSIDNGTDEDEEEVEEEEDKLPLEIIELSSNSISFVGVSTLPQIATVKFPNVLLVVL